MKRKIVFLMACVLMIMGIALIVNSVFGIVEKLNKKDETPLERGLSYLDANTESLAPASIGGDYTAIVLALADPENGNLEAYKENLIAYVAEKEGALHSSRYTEYSRTIIGAASVRLDPRDIGGYDLLTPILDTKKVQNQGINGCAWALMALDCTAPDSEETNTARESYIALILSAQNEDGSFGGLKHSEVDMTAMCLRAIAPYADRAEVADACRKGVEYLRASKSESGGFPSPYGESSEPISQSVMALCALGLTDDGLYTALCTELLTYQNDDGGFSHNKGADSDRLATEQALQALIAADLAKGGSTKLYSFGGKK